MVETLRTVPDEVTDTNLATGGRSGLTASAVHLKHRS
jgi:hypothetical protein